MSDLTPPAVSGDPVTGDVTPSVGTVRITCEEFDAGRHAVVEAAELRKTLRGIRSMLTAVVGSVYVEKSIACINDALGDRP